jgi:peptide/nickel transport system substrate-binding protein
VRFVLTNNEATVRSMAASGELTMSSQYQSPDTYDALAKMPRFKIVRGVTAVAFYLKLNTKVAPTNDVHIRKAPALATDYETVNGTILPGGDLTGPLPKTFAEAHLDTPAPKFDPEAAKAEIVKSAYAGKTDIHLNLTYVSSAKFEKGLGLLMHSNLQQIGFKVNLSGELWNRVTEIASKVDTTPNWPKSSSVRLIPRRIRCSTPSMIPSHGNLGLDGMGAESGGRQDDRRRARHR